MKKSVLLFIMSLIYFQSSAQNIFDDIANKVIRHLQETETTDENFVRHDTTLNKLGLTINAVCKVVLLNGQQVDGFIELASEGEPNGFYFEDAESADWPFSEFMKLSLHFERFERQSEYDYLWFKDRRILNWPVTKDTIRIAKTLNLRYMDWQGGSSYGTTEKKDIQISDKGLMLEFSRSSKQESHYILHDSLSIFQDLSPDTYIRKGFCPALKVRISEIKSFQLVEKPEQKWLTIIAQNRAKSDQLFKADANSGFNQKSNWYHSIIKNTELTQFIQNSIDLASYKHGAFGEK